MPTLESMSTPAAILVLVEDATLNIDPEDHQPDEEHVDEVAKDRQRRFQDEWE